MLKARSVEEQSNAILVSFDAKWDQVLKSGGVEYIFRKRGPTSKNINWMYVYIGSPEKSLIGRLPILQLDLMTTDTASNLASRGELSRRELEEYAGNYASLFVYHVGTLEPFQTPMAYKDLKQKYEFNPPQSFLYVSKAGQNELASQFC